MERTFERFFGMPWKTQQKMFQYSKQKQKRMAARFATVSSEDLTKFIDKSKNANTTKATNLWLRCYQQWAASKNKETNPERLSPVEQDQHLQYFYAEAKKQDGDDYEPSSLSALQSGIDRHLKEQNYPASIITSREFMSSRSVLEGNESKVDSRKWQRKKAKQS